jgi:hypothetical protein
MPSICLYVSSYFSEIDEDHPITHDPVIAKLNVLVNEAVTMHLFDGFNHLNEYLNKGQLVWDAGIVKVLLNLEFSELRDYFRHA